MTFSAPGYNVCLGFDPNIFNIKGKKVAILIDKGTL